MAEATSNIKTGQYPLLATKLYVPQLRSDLVRRTHLVEELNKTTGPKLTLISAPAGFGKTTLLSEWISQSKIPAAWISLDKDDNDPTRFIRYLVAALQNIDAGLGRTTLPLLHASRQLQVKNIIVNLIKEITESNKAFFLVLDDYHTIDSERMHEIIGLLLEYLPLSVHLVMATRADPPLPLARLRVSHGLNELRAADLAFSVDEATQFFNKIMGLNLSAQDISVLEARTEGWIAGLHLAALSMQGRRDIPGFIQTFAGDDRHVVDYLAEEVLNFQPEPVQDFLIKTSILNRLSAPLCDHITGKEESRKILDKLERANLFIIPLDNRRHWYRYHHLFAELLQQRLKQTAGNLSDELHLKASQWHEKNGLKEESVNHALRAHDFDLAAKLIGEILNSSWDYDNRTLKWHEMLPPEYIYKDAELCFFNAWMLFENGQYNKAEDNLKMVEHLIGFVSDEDTEIPDKAEDFSSENRAELKGKIATIRALIALNKNEISDIFKFAETAGKYLARSSSSWKALAVYTLGEAHFSIGKMGNAIQSFEDAAEAGRKIDNFFVYMIACLKMAEIKKIQGNLPGAVAILQHLMQAAHEKGLSNSAIMGRPYLSWGEILIDQNKIDEGLPYIKQGLELNKQGNEISMIGSSQLALARALLAKGDLPGAEEIIKEMNDLSLKSEIPYYIEQGLETLKVHVWLKKGKLDQACQWMRIQKPERDEEFLWKVFWKESKQLLFARILLAQGEAAKSLELLKPYLVPDRKVIYVLFQSVTIF